MQPKLLLILISVITFGCQSGNNKSKTGDLDKFVSTLDEDANPIAMIVKFK